MLNEIYLRRKNSIIIEESEISVGFQIYANHKAPIQYTTTFLKNLENLGYTFSEDLIEILRTFSIDEVIKLYREIIPILKELKGAHQDFNPVYPNFPHQVMEASESELYLNALIHYFSFQLVDAGIIETTWLPEYKKEERFPLLENTNLTIIQLGNLTAFDSMMNKLICSNTSISTQDKKDIEWFVKNRPLPSHLEISHKENLAYLVSLVINNNLQIDFSSNFKTATDVLRLAVALSDGDVSLAKPTKFRSFKRSERKLLLSYLNNCKSSIEEDMSRYKSYWIRLGERLHPSEYKNKFEKAEYAFSMIRNNTSIKTFNSSVESGIQNNSYEILELLKSRPGEFARRLDKLTRIGINPIFDFSEIANKVSTPVLLQVRNHFKNRSEKSELRTFFPKGNLAKVQSIKNDLPDIAPYISRRLVSICDKTLVDRFSNYGNLGNVYIDENLTNYIVPFSQRSASKALKTIVRGSKIPAPNKNTVRFFVWWKDGNERTDLDLSAVLLNEDFSYNSDLSYYNLRGTGCFHSGDITSAPNGACEFIDINKKALIDSKIRYVAFMVTSFTEQSFVELPECFAGWMARENPDSGEIFEAKTVENKIDITSDTKICIPLVIDLQENQVVWTDISLKYNPKWSGNNAFNNSGNTSLMVKALTTLNKPNLYDLFKLHAEGRGILVDDKEIADTIFSSTEINDISSETEVITPFDIERITSEYLE